MTLDLTPLFQSSIGFDHLDSLVAKMSNITGSSSYPPYNITKVEKYSYKITIALAGFEPKNVDIVLAENILYISSRGVEDKNKKEYLYKGIANRGFEKKFQLAENIKVSGAQMTNGLLDINLEKITPKIIQPIRIEIE